MSKIAIKGRAIVFREDIQVNDRFVLHKLNGFVYDECFTEYLGGTDIEDRLAEALEKGGYLKFSHSFFSTSLDVVTEYTSRRRLSEEEFKHLVCYTMGQWSDGIGENFSTVSVDKFGVSVQCLTSDDIDVRPYPIVTVTE